MKKTLISAVFALATLGIAQAQTIKFGHLDSEELMVNMPDVENVQKQLEEQQSSIENQLTALNEEFSSLMKDYETKMNAKEYTTEEQTKKEEELQGMYEKIQIYRQTAIQELQQKQQELMTPIIQRVRRAIEEVGVENDFTYIFDTTSGALPSIGSQSTDIAPLVKKKLGLN